MPHPIDPRAIAAARNNAIWCDTVSRAHWRAGEFLSALWLCRQPTPRFYPNVVTLAPELGTDTFIQMSDLLATIEPASWAIKDSFCALELAPLGFGLLFDAAWIWRAADLARPVSPLTDIRWAIIREVSDLARWEAAWNGSGVEPQPARIFLPELLEDANVAFIAAYQDAQIVAGAIVNRTGDQLGVSNVFAPEQELAAFWAGCIATAQAVFPGLAMVGYEAGAPLAISAELGFEQVGPLRVWLKVPH